LTGSETSRSRLSGILMMSRTAMAGDLRAEESAVNAGGFRTEALAP
jgi:hypothetical protein